MTHVHLGRPPEQLLHELTGKEGYASYGYQAVVAHDGFLLAACGGFAGATNDKTIARMDPAVLEVKNSELYKHIPFELLDADGGPYEVRGAWLICDGGYLKVMMHLLHCICTALLILMTYMRAAVLFDVCSGESCSAP